MLRIIHTADWHLGQTLAGYPRDHEHGIVLGELVALAAAREADALIVAGDVFDNQNPSATSQRLYFETLMALRRVRPQMTIVVTAGNHDAAGRLEAPFPLLEAMGVHVVGNVRRTAGRVDAARRLVALRNAHGEVAGHVLAVSYPTSACLPQRPPREEASDSCATRALYAELVEATGAGRDGLPLIVTGHLSVAGATESAGAERRIVVGGQHAVSADVFPAGAAYVALGHLHKAQDVKSGRAGQTVRYSGSLLPLSASEIGYSHGVSVVTLDRGGGVAAEHVPLARPVAFHRVPERGDVRLDAVADQLKALDLDPGLPVEWRPFVQVSLSREGLTAGYRAELDRLAKDYPVRLLDPRVARPDTDGATAADSEGDLVRLTDLDPEALFAEAFLATHHAAPGALHVAAFRAAATLGAEA
ncbi:MAG: exonuclease SbcCD subunit D [Hyphomicrobiaceae bacterium]|nr:exonuclease SbcCD subunit D [Hyphomicrobiaceae bacterium]